MNREEVTAAVAKGDLDPSRVGLGGCWEHTGIKVPPEADETGIKVTWRGENLN